jgi:hypothetical protein
MAVAGWQWPGGSGWVAVAWAWQWMAGWQCGMAVAVDGRVAVDGMAVAWVAVDRHGSGMGGCGQAWQWHGWVGSRVAWQWQWQWHGSGWQHGSGMAVAVAWQWQWQSHGSGTRGSGPTLSFLMSPTLIPALCSSSMLRTSSPVCSCSAVAVALSLAAMAVAVAVAVAGSVLAAARLRKWVFLMGKWVFWG